MNDESYPNSNIRDMGNCSYYCGLDSGVTKDRWSGEQ